MSLGVSPYHNHVDTVFPEIIERAKKANKIVFQTVGDTGGIKNVKFQRKVSEAMKDNLQLSDVDKPSFFYHLGDIVYYNGRSEGIMTNYMSHITIMKLKFFRSQKSLW